jgi:hypothetical protein
MKYNVGGTEITIDTVDDIYDGYGIALGWYMRQSYNTAYEALNNTNGVIDSFTKSTTHDSFLWDDWSKSKYEIKLKNGSTKIFNVSAD